MTGDTDQHCGVCGIYGSVEEIDPATSRCRDIVECSVRQEINAQGDGPEFA